MCAAVPNVGPLPKMRRLEDDEDHPAMTLRRVAASNLKKQADKMLLRGKGLLPPVNVGDNVLLSIPSVDRGRGDASNLIAVVVQTKDEKYQVATKDGVLNRLTTSSTSKTLSIISYTVMYNVVFFRWMERNSIASTKYKSLKIDEIPLHKELSLRELVRLSSVGTGQGYRRCACKQKCQSNRCACFKSGIICNSACHAGRSCENHD